MTGDTASLSSLADKLATAAVREDRLDRVRVFATLLMVAALFTIVVVIVNKKSPLTSLYQFVSLASGLAGIGLGWLFGTATTRSKKRGSTYGISAGTVAGDPCAASDHELGVGCLKSAIAVDLRFYAARSYSLMSPPRMGRAMIRSCEGRQRVVGPRRVQLAAAVVSAPVVVGLIFGQDRPQVPFAEDEHPVGDLGPGSEHGNRSAKAFARGLRGGIITPRIPALARTASKLPLNLWVPKTSSTSSDQAIFADRAVGAGLFSDAVLI